jgi:RNA polymerase sigma-70 factor (ECF subfamily)
MAVIIIPETLLQSTIDGCVAKDRASQKRFYMHYYGFALAVCSRYVSAYDDAVGILNDGYLKIFNELKNFTPRNNNLEGSLKAWMRRILVNTSIDYLRRNKNNPTLMDDMEGLQYHSKSHADDAASKLSYQELLALISRLSPAYRMVFNLFVIDGYSHEEISGMLHINIGTSKSNLAKARMNLQKMILNESNSEMSAVKKDNYERRAI